MRRRDVVDAEIHGMARMPPLEHARAERQGWEDGRRALRARLHGLSSLFGRSVHTAIEEPLEHLEERGHDAMRLYEEAIEDLEDRLGSVRSHLDVAQLLLEQAVVETEARFARARKAPPAWAVKSRGLLEGQGRLRDPEEPF